MLKKHKEEPLEINFLFMAEYPLVSIGMPVYNEERFIRASLESIIAQDYPNIELIISDNASTDNTGHICKEFSSQYDWITYHQRHQNHGPIDNFNYVLHKSKGKYFMWASGHDTWMSNYISSCAHLLETHPKATIVFGCSNWINEHGKTFSKESGWTDTRGLSVIARYHTVLWGNMHPILGLINSNALKQSKLLSTVGADLIALASLSLQGDFIHAANTHWSRREFRNENTYEDKLKRYKSSEYEISKTIFSRAFPLLRLPFELFKSVVKSNISLTDKIFIFFLLIPGLPIKYLSSRF